MGWERQSLIIGRNGFVSCYLEYFEYDVSPDRSEQYLSKIEAINAEEILDAVDRLIMNNGEIDRFVVDDAGVWDLVIEYDDGSRRSKSGFAIIDKVKGLRISTAIRHDLRRPDFMVFGGSCEEEAEPCVVLKPLE